MSNKNNDLNSEFLELYGMLNKSELKKINNQIAEERVEEDGPVRKLGNIAERAASILSGSGNKIPYTSEKDDKRFIELAKEIINNRENRNMGGMLTDDNYRMGYAAGTSEDEVENMEENSYPLSHLGEKKSTVVEAINNPALQKELIEKHGLEPDGFLMELSLFEKQQMGKNERVVRKAEGGSLLADDMSMMQEEEQEMPTHTMPDGTVMPGATHEESEEMEPDSEMEDNYLDFIINEALSEEEEDMLMSKLEQDEELSMLFDKVIEVASEFAGSGPVEGPGTGVSDSIPARLSDGEFVFTAKAVEEIGADNLMAMMKEAEMKADERQPVQTGGLMQQDEEAYQPTAAPMTEQVIRVEKGPQSETVGVGGSMLDPSRMEPTNPLYDEMAFKRPPVHGAGY